MVDYYNTKGIKIDDKFIGDLLSYKSIFTGFTGRRRVFWFFFPPSPQQWLPWYLLWLGHGRWIAQPPKSDYAAFTPEFVLLKFPLALQISVNYFPVTPG